MEQITQTYEWLVAGYGYAGCALMGAVVVLFVVQLCFWLGGYARIPKFRNGRRRNMTRRVDGVSVVVLLTDDMWYLDNTLPRIMAQDYPDFELLAVSVGSGEDFEDQLDRLKTQYPNLSSTHIDQDPKFPISKKMAYNVGIKGARYENIVLTAADAVPVSHKWLSLMAKGFETGEVVISYCGMERKKGFAGAMARCSRLMMSVRYLSAAIADRPYRGILQNMGFTRELYFRNRGFDHLSLNLGEDDLFIRKIAGPGNTSIVLNQHATVRQEIWGGMGWWWDKRRFDGAAYNFYPTGVRARTGIELASRLLFYVTVAILLVVTPCEGYLWTAGAGVAGLWFVRLLIVRYQVWRIRKRLGEGRLGLAMMFYDLVSPVVEIAMSLTRKISPAAGIWR